MLILIAESKTMSQSLTPVSAEDFTTHCPCFYEIAQEVTSRLRTLSVGELADQLGIGPKAAATAFADYYGFADISRGIKAVESFTGVVFKNFAYSLLPESGQAYTDANVRIISSLYGYLRPDDIISPYRMEFTSRVMPGHCPPRIFWRKAVTQKLLKDISSGGHKTVINLLPKDAADCIDWKEIEKIAVVTVADFKIQQADQMKTPHAGLLKDLRGKLLKAIAANGINSIYDLRNLTTDDFQLLEEASTPKRLLFLTA